VPLLVFITLALFQVLAFWVMNYSLRLALVLMPVFDITINPISLF
jgi:hypothetical protein